MQIDKRECDISNITEDLNEYINFPEKVNVFIF